MPDNFEIAVIRYLDKSMNDLEKASFSETIEKDLQKRKLFFQIKDVWDATDESSVPHVDYELSRLKKTIRKKKSKTIKYLTIVSRIAAIFIFGIIIGSLFDNFNNYQPEYNIVTVPAGSKSTIQLSDGTMVTLNSGSSIKYPLTFDRKFRKLSFSGEGYFIVAHNKNYPFIVSTDSYDIKVLGTEFNISAYSDFNDHTTSLIKGKIQIITPGKQETILEPGQKITYRKKENKFIVTNADIENDISWKDNIFSFKDEPFDVLIRRLEMHYDVDIIIKGNTIENATYTGKFRNHETIWQALDAIKTTSNIEYQRSGFREFTLTYNN